jgi:hypothetical protein
MLVSNLFEASVPNMLFWIATTIILCSVCILITREATSLRRILGPFFASISRLWLFQQQRHFRRPLLDVAVHKKYCPIVRISPDEAKVSSPGSRKIICSKSRLYEPDRANELCFAGASNKFRKGDWYIGMSECGWGGNTS